MTTNKPITDKCFLRRVIDRLFPYLLVAGKGGVVLREGLEAVEEL